MSISSCSSAVLLIFALDVSVVICKDCLLTNQCKCGFDDGSGSVDLTSLGHTDNTPRFKDVYYSTDLTYYSYNPCGGFNEGSCSNAAACGINQDKSQQLQIGDASIAKTSFTYDDGAGNVQVTYQSDQGVTEVVLVCEQSACEPKFEPQGQVSEGEFLMQLTTICACPGECTASGSPKCGSGSSGLGGGSILLIVFFSLLFVYLVVGILFMKFVKKAEGKEVIPNSSFWFAIPRNIKGGFVFVLSKVTRKQVTYDSI